MTYFRYNVCEATKDYPEGPKIAANSFGLEPEYESDKSKSILEEEHLDRNNQPSIFRKVLPYLALNEVNKYHN